MPSLHHDDLKIICIFRHAAYLRQTNYVIGNGTLTSDAITGLGQLPLTKLFADYDSFTLKTSPVSWALETAIHLNNCHHWLPGIKESNWSYSLISDGDPLDNHLAQLSHKARHHWAGKDVEILVTHSEICRDLPIQLARDLGWPDSAMDGYTGLMNGFGIILSLETLRYHLIHPK